ncbi:MAG: hypothetical protein TE42_08660, partial [Candidatus Synechococcus spongiarum SP3]
VVLAMGALQRADIRALSGKVDQINDQRGGRIDQVNMRVDRVNERFDLLTDQMNERFDQLYQLLLP